MERSYPPPDYPPPPKDELPPPYEPGPNPPRAERLPGAMGAFQALVGAHASASSLVAKGPLSIYNIARSDYYIARSPHDPNPLYYVATHGAFSSQPDVTLHVGCSPNNRIVATADYPTFATSINVSLFDNGKQVGGVTASKSGWINQIWGFQVRLPHPHNRVETFEWRDSGSDAVRGLTGSKTGMECVTGRGELVAIWASPGRVPLGMTAAGKVSFLPRRDGQDWGEGVEGLCLMTLLGLREKLRRTSRNTYF